MAKSGALAKVYQVVRELGVVDGVLYLLDALLARVTRGRARIYKYRLVAQPIAANAVAALRNDPTTVISAVFPNDALVQTFPRPPSVIRERYRQGASCLTAVVKGQFAGYLWWVRDRYVEDEVRCVFELEQPALSVWDFYVFVTPSYRFGRTLARLWAHANHELASQGIRWSFSRISAFNKSSITAHSRLGTVICHTALFFRTCSRGCDR